jgi:hypothetical protein
MGKHNILHNRGNGFREGRNNVRVCVLFSIICNFKKTSRVICNSLKTIAYVFSNKLKCITEITIIRKINHAIQNHANVFSCDSSSIPDNVGLSVCRSVCPSPTSFKEFKML